MRYWLGVTDSGWFDYLSHEGVDEVNFWHPSGKAPFVGLEPGAPFLFKLKRPFNHVAGGGFFVKFSVLPLSLAWDTFERKNGASTRELFESMIRPLSPDPGARDPDIGCTILASPFFWPRSLGFLIRRHGQGILSLAVITIQLVRRARDFGALFKRGWMQRVWVYQRSPFPSLQQDTVTPCSLSPDSGKGRFVCA